MIKYVVIDTETTGLDSEIHEMIAFGAIVMIGHDVVEKFEVKWHPVRPEQASNEAMRINGYSDYTWRDSVGVDRAVSLIDLFFPYSSIFATNFSMESSKPDATCMSLSISSLWSISLSRL